MSNDAKVERRHDYLTNARLAPHRGDPKSADA
jgi:hypothetical protein